MKTLYASDMDGTLLTSQQTLSNYSRQVLNELISQGMLFTIATARKGQSALAILEGVNLSAPVVLANGAFVYDSHEKRYLYAQTIPQEIAYSLIKMMVEYPVECCMTVFDGARVHKYTQEIGVHSDNTQSIAVHSERDLSVGLRHASAISFLVIGSFGEIEPLCRRVRENPLLWVCCYEDVYVRGTFWMEVYSHNVNKATGLQFVQEYLGIPHLVTFGDNVNDIEMLEFAEESYCVANALGQTKAHATAVLPHTNDEDAVARFLQQRLGGVADE